MKKRYIFGLIFLLMLVPPVQAEKADGIIRNSYIIDCGSYIDFRFDFNVVGVLNYTLYLDGGNPRFYMTYFELDSNRSLGIKVYKNCSVGEHTIEFVFKSYNITENFDVVYWMREEYSEGGRNDVRAIGDSDIIANMREQERALQGVMYGIFLLLFVCVGLGGVFGVSGSWYKSKESRVKITEKDFYRTPHKTHKTYKVKTSVREQIKVDKPPITSEWHFCEYCGNPNPTNIARCEQCNGPLFVDAN